MFISVMGDTLMGARNNAEGNKWSPPPPIKAREQFVGRANDLQYLDRHITSGPRGVLMVSGMGGSGKSSLLLYLRSTYSATVRGHSDKVVALYHHFNQSDTEPFNLPAYFTNIAQQWSKDIQEQLIQLQKILEIRESGKSLAWLEQARSKLTENRASNPINTIIEVLTALANQEFIILLLLDMDELPLKTVRENQEVLESQLLEPLLKTNRTVAVISNHSVIPLWHRYEVRKRVETWQGMHLQPFTASDVMALVAQRLPNATDPQQQETIAWLHKYAAGSPMLADSMLSATMQTELPTAKLKPILLTQLTDYCQWLLTEDVRIPKPSLEVLEMLLPLRYYRVETVRTVLQQWTTQSEAFAPLHERYRTYSDADVLALLQDMDSADPVYWSQRHRAYMTDPLVRVVLDRYALLRYEQKQDLTYIDRHTRACDYYEKRAEAYPKAAEDDIVELIFHHLSLYLATNNFNDLINSISDICMRYVRVLDVARLNRLKKLFDSDSPDVEMRELIILVMIMAHDSSNGDFTKRIADYVLSEVSPDEYKLLSENIVVRGTLLTRLILRGIEEGRSKSTSSSKGKQGSITPLAELKAVLEANTSMSNTTVVLETLKDNDSVSQKPSHKSDLEAYQALEARLAMQEAAFKQLERENIRLKIDLERTQKPPHRAGRNRTGANAAANEPEDTENLPRITKTKQRKDSNASKSPPADGKAAKG